MATQTQINETFDSQGNLLYSETVTTEIAPENAVLAQLVESLSQEQKAALLAALQQ